jgi:hypothetical protein
LGEAQNELFELSPSLKKYREDTESDTFDADPKKFSMLLGRSLYHRISPRSYFLCKSRIHEKVFRQFNAITNKVN